MVTKNARRHERIAFSGPIRLVWEERGETRYLQTTCLDISEGGLRVSAPVSIPVGTRVSLNADRIQLSGSASVKNLVRQGGKFILGLELSQRMQEKALKAIRANQAPVSQ